MSSHPPINSDRARRHFDMIPYSKMRTRARTQTPPRKRPPQTSAKTGRKPLHRLGERPHYPVLETNISRNPLSANLLPDFVHSLTAIIVLIDKVNRSPSRRFLEDSHPD